MRWCLPIPKPRLVVALVLAALAGCGGPGSGTRWGQGAYKVGAPYEVNGRWYYPAYDPNYDRVGTASWYGDEFNGLQTANGEVFDKDAISAAHPTLPLPSIVRVTNLENGRWLDLRVNDRGPFVGDRLIDLSEGAARKLGFQVAGLAPVRVKFLRLADAQGEPPPPPPAEVMVAQRQPEVAPQRQPDMATQRPPEPPPATPPVVRVLPADADLPPVRRPVSPPAAPVVIAQRELVPPAPAPIATPPGRPRSLIVADARPSPPLPRTLPAPAAAPPGRFPVCADGPQFIQVGAFSDTARVQAATATLAGLSRVRVEPFFSGRQALARVKLGPLPDLDAALGLLDRVRGLGYPEAFVVPAASSGRSEPASC